ncbi:MAG: DUF3726 domain-containing protein [Pseudomonadota bacterium]
MSGEVPLDQSLGEWESLTFKAARGAGYAWGMAEEFAFAAGWLAERGWTDWRGLVMALRQPHTACAVSRGCAWLDAAHALDADERHGPVHVCAPILATPFLDRVASRHVRHVTMQWRGACVQLLGFGNVRWHGAALAATESELYWRFSSPRHAAPQVPAGATHTRAHVAAKLHGVLSEFAWRTYVPASDRSRAGAGPQVDDD